MKISSQTNILENRFGALYAVRMNCEAGFEAIDYTMYEGDGAVFDRSGFILAREMKRVASSYGVSFNQAHAPFSKFRLGAENEEKNRAVFKKIYRSIEIAAELGAKRIIVHPAFICRNLTADERYEMNMEIYGNLLPHARELDVEIAIENMWGRDKDNRERIVKDVCSDAEELIRYVDGMNSPYVTACLDVGHAGLVGESADAMVRSLGSRLSSIHIHDNDFKTDIHTLPYLGKINFDALTTALADVSYKGDVTMEADCFLNGLPDAVVASALTFTARIAAHLRDEIERKKQGGGAI